MKNLIAILLLLTIGGIPAMDFVKNPDATLSFGKGGSAIGFQPSLYTGVVLNHEVNYYLYLPMWESGTRTDELRLDNKPLYVRVLAENALTRTVEAEYALLHINEAKQVFFKAKQRVRLQFKQYQDLPLVKVNATLLNPSDETFDVQAYWMGRNIPAKSMVTSVRWSPPPDTVITEELTAKPQMMTHPHYFVRYPDSGSFGLIGHCGKECTGALLMLYQLRTEVKAQSTVPLMEMTFVVNPASYEQLIEFDNAMKVMDSIAFADGSQVSLFQTGKTSAAEQSALSFAVKNDTVTAKFTAYDSAMDKRVMNCRAANDPVYTDDCVELSLLGNAATGDYCHFMANPRGAYSLFSKGSAGDGEWKVSAADAKGKWNATFTIPTSFCDPDLLKNEGVIRFHANRETQFHHENSGYPTGAFHAPEKFGRLLLTSYPDYLKRQLAICRGMGTAIEADPDSNDAFANALLDLKLQALRKLLAFERAELRLGRMIEHWQETSDAERAEAVRLLEQCRKLAETDELRSRFQKLEARYLSAVSNGKAYTFWVKPPFDYLSGSAAPQSADSLAKPFSVEVLQGECDSLSAAAANLTDKALELAVKVTENPGSLAVEFREGHPMPSTSGKEVNDALLKLAGGKFLLPAFASRELWITVKAPDDCIPGNYPLTIKAGEQLIRANVTVHPLKLVEPADFVSAFYTLYAGYPASQDAKTVAAFKRDLVEHHASTVTTASFPMPEFDEAGNNLTDYSKLAGDFVYVPDKSAESRIIIYWSYTNDMQDYVNLFEKNLHAKWDSPEFDDRFSRWITDWQKAIKAQGFQNQIYMYPVDEQTSDTAFNLIRKVKKCDPAGKIFLTVTTTGTVERLASIMPSIDAIAPHYYTWAKSRPLMDAIRKNKLEMWPYFNVHPCSYADEGYSVYRRMSWHSAGLGATGFGTWLYFQTAFLSWKHPDMSMVYMKTPLVPNALEGAPETVAEDDIIITSKRWEGYREGAEDYFILRMLEARIAASEDPAFKADGQKLVAEALSAVAGSNDPALAEAYKRKFIQMLLK